MDRCQLATLVKWAGTLKTRKRLQKVVYLLQAAGCELNAEYTLHHYGPYSQDVASLTNEMVQAGLLCEETTRNSMAATSFSYQLSPEAQTQLDHMERDPAHQQRFVAIHKHQSLADRLLKHDLQELEFGATIAYFRNKKSGADWADAREAAARFKNQDPNSPAMREAERFARQILEPENADSCPQR